MRPDALSRTSAILLLGIVIVAWGTNWSVSKAVLQHLPPIWATALRMIPACIALWAICLASRTLVVPKRGDVPVILSVALLHMTAFSVLATIGLQYLPAGRSVVLAYTMPLWVIPAARWYLGEAFNLRTASGLALGMAGLVFLLNPAAIDWANRDVLTGHGLILLAAVFWAACIVYGRKHAFITSPFQLLPWQLLLTSLVQIPLAFWIEGAPAIAWSPELLALLGYSSLVGTVLAYWAMNTVNRGLPASVTSMSLLGVPIAGLAASNLMLGEPIDGVLMVSAALIVAGVALSTLGQSVPRAADGA